jgi:RNase P/RNase MRP subunit POP5
VPKVGSLLPAVQDGLEEIAKSEKRSVSWVIAEIVSDYFGLDCETNKSKPKLKSKYHVTSRSVTSTHPTNSRIKLVRPLKRRA